MSLRHGNVIAPPSAPVLSARESMERHTLTINRDQFDANFNRRHFGVEHSLASNPLFELPRLLSLAQEVAKRWPRDLHYDVGVTNVGNRWGECAKAPVDDVIRNMENAGAWIDLKSAERHPAYQRILDACIGDLLRISGRELRNKMRRTQLAIFITSPNRLSTYHIDSECNFLLQVRGTKQISLFDRQDRVVLPEEEIERAWSVDTNAAVYKPQYQARAEVVTLTPGTGVHIPVNAPHWVQNGPQISVSAAILYHWWNREYANVYAANYVLRHQFKRHPLPPKCSKALDLFKQPLGAAFLAARRAKFGKLRPY